MAGPLLGRTFSIHGPGDAPVTMFLGPPSEEYLQYLLLLHKQLKAAIPRVNAEFRVR